jgi:hypothetical protein
VRNAQILGGEAFPTEAWPCHVEGGNNEPTTEMGVYQRPYYPDIENITAAIRSNHHRALSMGRLFE